MLHLDDREASLAIGEHEVTPPHVAHPRYDLPLVVDQEWKRGQEVPAAQHELPLQQELPHAVPVPSLEEGPKNPVPMLDFLSIHVSRPSAGWIKPRLGAGTDWPNAISIGSQWGNAQVRATWVVRVEPGDTFEVRVNPFHASAAVIIDQDPSKTFLEAVRVGL